MVSLTVVSHSPLIVQGLLQLTGEIAKDASVRGVGGTNAGTLGADFDKILETLEELSASGEVIVLTDLGSSRMTTQMAIEALPPDRQKRVFLSDAALVEGAIAAAAIIAAGLPADEVLEQLEPLKLPK